MKPDYFVERQSVIYLKEIVKFWTPIMIIGSLVFILVATLFPFNFSFEEGFSLKLIFNSFYHPSNLGDRLRNILLFVPFGFSVACLMPGEKLGGIFGFIVVLIVSISLSLTVESLQAFLPMRASSIPDLITNTFGGGIGFFWAYLGRFQILVLVTIAFKKCQKLYSLKILTSAFIGYFSLMSLTAIALQTGTNLSNWDPNFFLSLGNKSADIYHPWKGHISQLEIADRALAREEIKQAFSQQNGLDFIGDSLIASYPLIEGKYSDKIQHSPAFTWLGIPPESDRDLGVSLSSDSWLKTAKPAVAIARKLSKSSQFTISSILTTADPFQVGTGNIISLSSDSDPYQSNFTLAQQETDLVFRLRSPVTGNNGTYPEIIVPDVFVDLKPYHVIITYDGLALRFYIDLIESVYSLDLSPNITFFRYLLYFWDGFTIRLDKTKASYKILYYAIVFIPLGILLGLIFKILKGKSLFNISFVLGGIILPSLILEGASVKGNSMILNPENILLSLSVVIVTVLLVKGISLPKLKTLY